MKVVCAIVVFLAIVFVFLSIYNPAVTAEIHQRRLSHGPRKETDSWRRYEKLFIFIFSVLNLNSDHTFQNKKNGVNWR